MEFDYAIWATGLNRVPDDLPQPLSTKFGELRGDGVEGRSTPEEIRTFFSDAGMLTPEREEILKDYEHYIAARKHRREDVWRRRHE